MGQALRIGDLAQRIIEWGTPEGQKAVDIDIIGLRAGEKLREELTTQGLEMKKTSHPRIWSARQKDVSRQPTSSRPSVRSAAPARRAMRRWRSIRSPLPSPATSRARSRSRRRASASRRVGVSRRTRGSRSGRTRRMTVSHDPPRAVVADPARERISFTARTHHPHLSAHERPSSARVLEDGVPLPGPAMRCTTTSARSVADASRSGTDFVYFSSSDNSDPRTNGRRYEIEYEASGARLPCCG